MKKIKLIYLKNQMLVANSIANFIGVINDEIGYTGDAINEMTKGLIERKRMQLSLNLAKEVQQNLLPKNNLKINGFDIAGKSVYCDETGGDYYDFISIGKNHNRITGVAIGDVSGHGISSALLMATVRSSLRQRASQTGNIAEIIDAIFDSLDRFIGEAKIEDDITSVVIKMDRYGFGGV